MNQLENKYGWGCKDNHVDKQALAIQIEQLEINSSLSPAEVLRYVAKLVKNLQHCFTDRGGDEPRTLAKDQRRWKPITMGKDIRGMRVIAHDWTRRSRS